MSVTLVEEDMFMCPEHNNDDVYNMSQKCEECPEQIYTPFRLCISCAFVKNVCKQCLNPLDSGRTESAVEEVRNARKALSDRQQFAQECFENAIGPFKKAVTNYLKAYAAANEISVTAGKKEQAILDTASKTLQTIQGANGDTTCAKQSYDDAVANLQAARAKAALSSRRRIEAAEKRFKQYKPQYMSADNKRSEDLQQAHNLFNLDVQRVLGHFEVDRNYRECYEKLRGTLGHTHRYFSKRPIGVRDNEIGCMTQGNIVSAEYLGAQELASEENSKVFPG